MTTPDTSATARAPSSGGAESRSGDFETLLESVIDVAYRTAYQFTGSDSQAESLVADAALQASRQHATCPQGKGFKSWFLRIMTTVYLAGVPELEAHRVGSSQDESEVCFSSLVTGTGPTLGSDSARRFTDKLDADSIRLALQRLPREYVAVTALSLADSLSHQEIATALDASVDTVRSTLHRGRALLKQALWETVVARGLA